MMEKIRPFLTLVKGRWQQQKDELDKLFQNTKSWEEYEKHIKLTNESKTT